MTKKPAKSKPIEGAPHPVVEAVPVELPSVEQLPIAKRRVSLAASTPLLHATLDVVADTDADAITKFNTANGISGSDHPYTVEVL